MPAKITKYRIFTIFVCFQYKQHSFLRTDKVMKYFIRSVKYFFYFAFLTTAIVLVLVFIGAVEGDIDTIFDGGVSALWKIAVFFAVVAAAYPKFGFVNRRLETEADWETVKVRAVAYFREKPFILESETEDTLTFRRRSPAARLLKMGEDRITVCRKDGGYVMEGLRKDVFLYATGLEYSLNDPD